MEGNNSSVVVHSDVVDGSPTALELALRSHGIEPRKPAPATKPKPAAPAKLLVPSSESLADKLSARQRDVRLPGRSAREILTEKHEIVAVVEEHLPKIREAVPQWVSHWRSLTSDSERELVTAEIEEAETYILELLNDPQPEYQRVARQAYAVAMAESCPASKTALNAAIYGDGDASRLPGLQTLGLVRELGATEPTGVNTFASVKESKRVALKAIDPEIGERLTKAFRDVIGRERAAIAKYIQGKLDELRPRVTMEALDLPAGKKGVIMLPVPDIKDKKHIFGTLLIESDGEKAKIIGVVGVAEELVRPLIEAGRTLTLRALNFTSLNVASALPEVRKQRELMHRLIRDGVSAERERVHQSARDELARQERNARVEEERLKEAEALAPELEEAKKATVSMIDFVMKDAVGTAFVDMDEVLGTKPWVVEAQKQKENDRLFRHIRFLLERNEAGDIRLVWSPLRLSELFGTESSTWRSPGNKFAGLKYPLVALLRTVFAHGVDIERREKRRNQMK